ncbi:MAG: metallophosphoesterase [Acidobacteria bacterium]|nr:metallophosphoesterase [Acidobacteriota bacterium]
MRAFNWLHLTDLHFGLGGQAPLWPNVRDVFFDDLSSLHEKSGPWHAVLFTGDLVQSGQAEEFAQLEEKVLGPLWERLAALGSNDTILLTVPGNHDLSRPDAKKPTAALRQLLRKGGFDEIAEEFWAEPNCEYREIIAKAFQNYQSWSGKALYQNGVALESGVLPGDFAASVIVPTSNGLPLRIGIAGANTTFLQLAAGDYSERLAWDAKQLHNACGDDLPFWAKSHDACLLLTHQGPLWLDESSRNEVYPEINPAGRFAVHLFGHMHDHVVRSTSFGGGKPLRQWQGCSLFGMEKFGEPPTTDRRHGYSAGRIEFSGKTATIRQWPRRAIKDPNGWRFDRDAESCVLAEYDGGTQLEEIRMRDVSPMVSVRSRANEMQTEPTTRETDAANRSTHASSKWPWPYDEIPLRSYCQGVSKAHSHIRFVEIPYLKDVSDVEMDSLYVEPRFSAQEIHPDLAPFKWPKCVQALEALREHRQLVLLGDPGSGKSTLVSYLSWQLCRPKFHQGNAWTKQFGGCVPLPIVLRELRLKADLTWEGLLDAFLEHRIGKLLPNRKTVETLFKEGRAIVLLDGLDEIGNLTIRKKLRDAVHAGMTAHDKSVWILTSRMVAYDLVPFHFRIETVSSETDTTDEVLERKKGTKRVRTAMADLLYLAPFNDEQIRTFATNWYTQHEKDKEVVKRSAHDFVQAIRENEGTQRLARIPYLLTLMALIHHKNARLPHGRTELYERIATAYLESIDLRRQLDQLPYSLAQKKRWLADVAFRMQLRRAKKRTDKSQGDILASKAEVQKWLRAAMRESGASDTMPESSTLLDYFAQRSGLLLPRGEGKFAFMHLSLQEYFAACFLEPRLTASRFSPKQQKVEPSDEQLRMWANDEAWRETFVLLFELLSEKSASETEAFLDHLFEGRLDGDKIGREATAAGLLAELATDPFVLLPAETRRRLRQQSWRWCFGLRAVHREPLFFGRFGNKVERSLISESQGDLQRAWKVASISRQELRSIEGLDLTGCSSLCDLTPLRTFRPLKHLNLRDCLLVSDISALSELKSLKSLVLEGCSRVLNIEALTALKSLEYLVLGAPADLTALAAMESLKEIHLHYPQSGKVDLTPLAGLTRLSRVCAARDERDIRVSDELQSDPKKIASEGVRRLVVASLRRRLPGTSENREKRPSSVRFKQRARRARRRL